MKITNHILIYCIIMGSLSGCSPVKSNNPERFSIPKMGKMDNLSPNFYQSAMMYLKPEPYKWIYMEIDTIEGAEPDDEAVLALVNFLETYCQKPVVINRGKIIPHNMPVDLPSPHAIATQYIDGPIENNEVKDAAYIYLLFFNGSKKQGAVACALDLYKCGIMVNMSRLKPSLRWNLPQILVHEAGHILGLCHNPDHCDAAHCKNRDCIMYERPVVKWSISNYILGQDPYQDKGFNGLCNQCKHDIFEINNSEAICKLKFKGPFLIREEQGYYVASLPSHLHLGLGSMDIDWGHILKLARELSNKELSGHPVGSYTTSFSQNYASEEEKIVQGRTAIEAALCDPDQRVVKLANELKDSWAY